MQKRLPEEITQVNQRIEMSGLMDLMDEVGKTRFEQRLNGVAQKRGVPFSTIPHITTWTDMIELDEDRL